SELGFPIDRFHGAPGDLPAGATTWWIGPPGVCRAPDAPSDDAWTGAAFARAGGTAVVFLRGAATHPCVLAGLVLPAGETTKPGSVDGPGGARTLNVPAIPAFVQSDGWTVRAASGKLALVVEAPLGSGRVVAVSDASLIENRVVAEHGDV